MKIGRNVSNALLRSGIFSRAHKAFGLPIGLSFWRRLRLLIGFSLCLGAVILVSGGRNNAVAQIPSATRSGVLDSNPAISPAADTHANTNLTYKVIAATQDTWVYDVFANGRLMIHQTSIPALPGNEGFKTKEDASKVASLVIAKIKKGEMPPTISIEEMKNLSVIK